jgi:acyl-CoA thioesterase FadM
VNLWLRLLHLIVASFFRARLDPSRDVSRLDFRVWPHDLDTSLHMNNGRYWTIMDLGRADLMIRSGLWRAVLREKWTPVVSAAKIRFRRELKPFRAFRLETRIVAWCDTWLVASARDGSEILSAIALVRAGLYDRSAKRFVPVERMFTAAGIAPAPAPVPAPEVEAFIAAEEALKQAA